MRAAALLPVLLAAGCSGLTALEPDLPSPGASVGIACAPESATRPVTFPRASAGLASGDVVSDADLALGAGLGGGVGPEAGACG